MTLNEIKSPSLNIYNGRPTKTVKAILAFIFQNIPIVGIIIISLVPLIWFRPWNTLITSGDFWLPVGTMDMWRSLFSSWLPNIAGGQTNNTIFEIFPWVSFWAFFKSIPFSLSSTEKIWFVTMFLLGGLSVYFLTLEVYKNKEPGWKNFIPSLFYLFNLYIMMAGTNTTNMLIYMVNPLFLLFYIRGLNTTNIVRSAITLGLITLLFASAAGNPPAYTIPFVTIGTYFLFLLFFRKLTWRFILFNLLFAITYFLFNIWWIYFYIQNVLSQAGTLKAVASASAIGGSSNFSDVLRLLGSWAFFAGHLGYAYFPFANSYLNPVLMFLTFIIPMLVWAGFFLRRAKDGQTVTFFAFLGILGLVLSHGKESDLLGQLNSFINKVVPYFWIYREPYSKFSTLTAVSYAILLGSLFSFLQTKLQSSRVLLLVGFVISALILTVSWPLVIGDHFPGKRGILAPSRKTIPQYWFDVANWLKGKEKNGRVLVLPDNPDWNRSGIPYVWGYDSADLVPFLLTVPWIERNNGFYVEALMQNMSNVSTQVYKSFHEIDAPVRSITPMLQLLNVNRLLQRNDVDLARVGPLSSNYSPERIRAVISQQSDLSLEKSFGALDVYRLEPDKVWGKFYVPQRVDCLIGNSESLVYSTDFFENNIKEAIFSPKNEDIAILNYCGGFFIAPVEITKRGPYYSSAQFRPYFGASPTNVNVDLATAAKGILNKDRGRYFVFQVPKNGVYEVFLEKRRNIKYDNPQSLLSVFRLESLDKPINPSGLADRSSSALSDGIKFNFVAGPHLLLYNDAARFNIIRDGSFEVAAWKTSLSKDTASLSDESFTGSASLSLGPGVSDAYYVLPKDKLEARTYSLSFYYKVKSGTVPTFFVWENNCDKEVPIWTNSNVADDSGCRSNFTVQPSLLAEPEWTEYNAEYIPSLDAKRMGIGFVFLDQNRLAFANTGQTLIDDVLITAKLTGGVILKGPEGDAASESLGNPSLSVIKSSPTQYVLGVSQARAPYFLVFSETFNKDWQLSIRRPLGLRLPISSDHYMVNGYASSWYINETGDYQIEIKYSPENKFRFLMLVSAVSLLSSLLYLFDTKFHYVSLIISMFKNKVKDL